MLGGEASSESIILEEAEYKLEEITTNIDRIMSDVRKRNRSSRKRDLIHKGMMAGQNEKSGELWEGGEPFIQFKTRQKCQL